ncbi:flagellar motor protein MotB [Telmatospirillum sp. J64-1]|uniref:OmpA/MotB family protein n=1 Tax=Telmatospirillum sp. J64-1 TaxID=2502183 RepID=UPI00115E6407|nr:flagellar motor protein MotB [Telmatospirillum sp. J64-1]
MWEENGQASPYQAPAPSNRAWMITFADLISLMLTFFVMLYAMSSINVETWRPVADMLARRPMAVEGPETAIPTAPQNITATFRKRAINLDYLHAVIEKSVAADPVLAQAILRQDEDRIILSLPGSLFFQPASARLDRAAEDALYRLGGMLVHIANPVAVIGHDEAAPLARDSGYSSSWELSLGRAAAVANALNHAGYDRDVTVLGAGSGRATADLESFGPGERTHAARRVDIIILAGGMG